MISNYSITERKKTDSAEMIFWRNRIDKYHPGLINEQKYGSCLLARFYKMGNIEDLNSADTIFKKLDERFNQTEPSISLMLAHISLMRHQFGQAKKYVQEARDHDARRYPLLLAAFDVSFERGEYDSARFFLYAIRGNKDFNYFFRLSKWQHLNGATDSALSSMVDASRWTGQDSFSRQVALSNAGDLCVHMGKLREAVDFYFQSLELNPSDFHSLSGLGRIALLGDHHDFIAEKIFQFIRIRSPKPDVLLRLAELEKGRGREAAAQEYLRAFISAVNTATYGNMYNKYLIDLYTGIFPDREKAEMIAQHELLNRETPQTFAWYAWTLSSNQKNTEAYEIFQKHVSGRPLEALELYWMGNMFSNMHRSYDALAFFQAAKQNRFDFPAYSFEDIQRKSGE